MYSGTGGIIDDVVYETGRKVEVGLSGKNDVIHDKFLPSMNYVAKP